MVHPSCLYRPIQNERIRNGSLYWSRTLHIVQLHSEFDQVRTDNKRFFTNNATFDLMEKKIEIENAGLQDEIEMILRAIAEGNNSAVGDIAKPLRGSTLIETARNIWNFERSKIKYKERPPHRIVLKTSNRTLLDKECNASSFCILSGALLQALEIKFKLRVAEIGPGHYHSWIIVPDGSSFITIDPLIDLFNRQHSIILRSWDY